MSISGYFNKNKAEVRMPKSDPYQPDGSGIRYVGRVLNGEFSVAEGLRMSAMAARRRREGPPEEPDAVLRAHMGLEKK